MIARQKTATRNTLKGFDVIVAGAGVYGLTIAERVANVLGRRVCVLERRDHIGGNCYCERDAESDIECHKYGTHIFHTKSEQVWRYLNGFTTLTDYRHRVLTVHRAQVYAMPVNLATICSFFGRYMTPNEAQDLIRSQAASESLSAPANLEEKAISLIGRPLYEAFIKGYTKKQWQTDPRQLPPEIITRLPVRFDFEPYYFTDAHQGLPTEGYNAIFRKMVDSPGIDVRFGVDFLDVRHLVRPEQLVVYSGPIDRYFGYQLGPLAWRTLDFEKQVLDTDDFQGTAVLNYSDEDVPYTRIHEFKHLHRERKHRPGKTVIYREYSRFASPDDEPYYPMNTPSEKQRFAAYWKLARKQRNVVFGGRLGTYQYLDVDQVIGAALRAFYGEIATFFGARTYGLPQTAVARTA